MVTKQAAAAATRERLIESALTVLKAHGAGHLTLENVARQAGVSKGGLLHHFPGKDALIEAVVRRLYEMFNTRAQFHYDNDPEPVGRWLRAYVRASFEEFEIPFEIVHTFYTYINDFPILRTISEEDFQMWHQRIAQDEIPPVQAAIVRMTCDQFWTERTNLLESEVSPESLQAELLSMTYPKPE